MKTVFLILLVVILVIPILGFSQKQEKSQGIVVCTQTPCSWQDLSDTIINLIKTVVYISFWIAFLMVSIGAFKIMFAGASEKMYQQGKDLIWTAIWAYVLILASGIIFDIILQFFTPKFKTLILPQIVFAQSSQQIEIKCPSDLKPDTFFCYFKAPLMSVLKCGQNAPPLFNNPALGKLFACVFEVIGLLKNIAVVLLVFAIIASAFYLITTPISGLGNIGRAYKILVWSIIGLIIILLADIIKIQVEKLVK